MSFNSFKTLKFAAVAAAFMLISAPWTADAATGYATTGVKVRAGPGSGYPVIGSLSRGQRVNIEGCVRGMQWCDISAWGDRGWVPGSILRGYRNNRDYDVTQYGGLLGLLTLVFDEPDYWGRNYYDRDFYRTRYYGTPYWDRYHRSNYHRYNNYNRRNDWDRDRWDRDWDRDWDRNRNYDRDRARAEAARKAEEARERQEDARRAAVQRQQDARRDLHQRTQQNLERRDDYRDNMNDLNQRYKEDLRRVRENPNTSANEKIEQNKALLDSHNRAIKSESERYRNQYNR